MTQKEQILKTGFRMAQARGLAGVTRVAVAAELKISAALISYHFGNSPKYRDAILEYAISRKNTYILAQGLAAANPVALAAPEYLKQRAQEFLND